jgi:DNA-binding CsgD family transcriptional regulator/tetratricopeptide (TPR) repeat protein
MPAMLPALQRFAYWAFARFLRVAVPHFGILAVMKSASSPAFIDRVEESQMLDAALERARSGAAPTVFVGGEAGIGKSRLVAEFARRAREHGARVLTGGCAPLGGAPLPFGPVVEILRALGDEERASLPPELGGRGGQWQRLDEFESGQGWVFALLLGVLEEIEAPLVVVLEDLHWADRSTLDLLALRVQTGRLPGCLVVGTYRSDELGPGSPLRLAFAELDRTGRTERIELHRFGRAELVEQMTGILGDAPEHDVVDDVLGRSDGNPFLAEELLAAREAPGAGTPTRVRDIVLARVETLSEPTQTMLRVLAAARGPLAHHALAVVSGLPERELEGCLREALARHVLVRTDAGAYAFRHALMREAIYEALLVSERRRLHGALADVLERSGDTSARRLADLAHHWYSAGDRPRALAAAVRAGLAVDEIYAHAEALEQYEHALELWDDAEAVAGVDRVAILARAAESASCLGDPARAVAFAEQALGELDTGDDPVRAGLLSARLGRFHWIGGDPERSLAAYENAVRIIPATPPTKERAHVIAALSHVQLVSGRHRTAADLAAESLEIARVVGALPEEGSSLATLGSALSTLGELDQGLAMVRAGRAALERGGGVPELIFVTYSNEAVMLIDSGAFEQAAEVARRGIEYTRTHGMERSHRSWQEVLVAWALLKLGGWHEAGALLDETLLRNPTGITRRAVQLMRAALALAAGELEAADERLADARAASEGEEPFAGLRFEIDIGLALARRDLDAARAHAATGLETIAGQENWPDLAWLYWRALEVEAARAEAARAHKHAPDTTYAAALQERVRALVADADARASAELPALLVSCEAELERADARPATDRWLTAAAQWEALREPYPRAQCLRRAAEAGLAERRPKADIAPALTVAYDLASQLGAAPLVTAVESLARRARVALDIADAAPAPEAPPLGLTPRELEVLRLVGRGYTNAQIAETLFISVKTAGAHVSNILAKLDVGRRVEAAAIAERLDLLDESPAR